jgi:hypothetical protein
MITYTEKGIILHDLVIAAGYSLNHNNTQAFDSGGNQSSAIDIAVQAIMDAYDPLPLAKTEAINRVNLHATSLIASIYGFLDINNPAEAKGLVDFMTDLYTSTIPAAREVLSGNMLTIKNTNDTRIVKIAEVNVMTNWQLVDAYDATVGW